MEISGDKDLNLLKTTKDLELLTSNIKRGNVNENDLDFIDDKWLLEISISDTMVKNNVPHQLYDACILATDTKLYKHAEFIAL